METPDTGKLVKLSSTDETVSMTDEDVRGRSVKDKDGERIGTVHDLLVDQEQNKVRFLLVESGGFLGIGETKSFIPVDAVTRVTEDEVFIDQAKDAVAAAPGYDPKLVDDRSFHESVYGHYGYTPFWAPGYSYPAYPLYGDYPGIR